MGHLPHQEPLNGAVVFGDDEVGFVVDRHGAHADGTAQVDDGNGNAADVRHAADIVMGARHLVEMGQLHHLPHLEDVDRKELLGTQPEHQQLQAILPSEIPSFLETQIIPSVRVYKRCCFR